MSLPLSTPRSRSFRERLEVGMNQDEMRRELHAHLTEIQGLAFMGLIGFPNREIIIGLLKSASMLLEKSPLTPAVTRDLRRILAEMT